MKNLLRNQLFWAGAVLLGLIVIILLNNQSASIAYTNGALHEMGCRG